MSQLYCDLLGRFTAGDKSQRFVIYDSLIASAFAVVVLEFHSVTSIKLKVTLSTYTSFRRIGELREDIHSFLTFALQANGYM